MADTIMFDPPCTEGVIERRRSQFTMAVAVGGETVLCHCPTTGRVGNIDLAGRPCLLSPSQDPGRKTRFTVEAVSLDRPEDSSKKWIGINQNAANRYVEHYLRSGGFEDMVGRGEVRREVFLGRSKLDFLVGDTYVEVKTPLQDIQLDIPGWVRTKKTAPFSSTDRFVRHITELADSLESHQKAVLLVDFVYDNPGFKVITHSIHYEEVKDAVDSAKEKGVEIWQANFEITAEGVALRKHFPIDVRRCRQDPRPARSPICARSRGRRRESSASAGRTALCPFFTWIGVASKGRSCCWDVWIRNSAHVSNSVLGDRKTPEVAYLDARYRLLRDIDPEQPEEAPAVLRDLGQC